MAEKRNGFDKRERDRRYVKFKSKRIKREQKRGNSAAANRHAMELVQYLGLDESSETPIEGILAMMESESSEMAGTDRLKKLRQEFGSN